MTVQFSTLPNGLRVVTHRMEAVESVSLGMWVHVGTRHERPEINGIAHMLEHMAFKGTKRRSALAIAEEIEDVGGHLNAYTSREFTAYHATVLKGDEVLAVDILADILQHSVFDQDELERERAVILQEIGQTNDTPDDVVFDHFQEIAFPDQPVGRSVLGTVDIVSAMPREALQGYMDEHYSASRMVFSAAGNIEHDAMVRLVETAFDDLLHGGEAAGEPARYVGGVFRQQRDLEQAHLVLGFQGISFTDPDYYPLSVLSVVLGGGMSSRLFQEVREKRGLVYAIYTFAASYRDSGLFGVYAGTGEAEAGQVMDVIADQLRDLAGTIGPGELKRARAQIRAGVLMSLESTVSRCEQLARQLLVLGREIPIAEISERIEAVDEAALDRIARRIFSQPATFAALGPIKGAPDFDAIVNRLL
ncbi:MAG: pitrilysin family protein [Pseudomonadota bacterium]|nr:pitrilysin family protein [Pseudomonadota bacterium]